jgi:hypothetical protein
MTINAWRNANRRIFNEQKKRNYARGKGDVRKEKSGWMIYEDEMILSPRRPCDRELARELERSVQAIQVRRSRLRKKENC